MQISETLMKAIAIGLIPVFLVLTFVLPKTPASTILLGGMIFSAFVLCFIGMSMQKKKAKGHDDLLAIPPRKP